MAVAPNANAPPSPSTRVNALIARRTNAVSCHPSAVESSAARCFTLTLEPYKATSPNQNCLLSQSFWSNARARWNTASSMSSVSRPVEVFCCHNQSFSLSLDGCSCVLAEGRERLEVPPVADDLREPVRRREPCRAEGHALAPTARGR